jgi:hypothetical protein
MSASSSHGEYGQPLNPNGTVDVLILSAVVDCFFQDILGNNLFPFGLPKKSIYCLDAFCTIFILDKDHHGR